VGEPGGVPSRVCSGCCNSSCTRRSSRALWRGRYARRNGADSLPGYRNGLNRPRRPERDGGHDHDAPAPRPRTRGAI
jgi:hypothetical protein